MQKQPVILISGASSGIGAATGRLFAQQGYRVALAARRFELLESLAQEINSQGGAALPVAADIRNLPEVQGLVKQVEDAFGRVDVLFNCAGLGRFGWLEELDPVRDVQGQISVNLTGMIWVTQAVLPIMIRQRSGQIIQMASAASYVATPTYSIYSASKFAVRGFSQALGREVGVYNIKVSTIYPGTVETDFGVKANIRRKTNMQMPGWLTLSPERVAQAVWGLVQKPRRSLVLPWPLKLAAWMNALLPGAVDWAIEHYFVRKERF